MLEIGDKVLFSAVNGNPILGTVIDKVEKGFIFKKIEYRFRISINCKSIHAGEDWVYSEKELHYNPNLFDKPRSIYDDYQVKQHYCYATETNRNIKIDGLLQS